MWSIPVIRCHGEFNLTRNLLFSFLAFVSVYFVTTFVAFSLRPGKPTILIETAIDFLWCVDIILSFRTTYLDGNDYAICMFPFLYSSNIGACQRLEVQDPDEIFFHYLYTWFFVDLVSSIPIQLILSSSSQSSNYPLLEILLLLKLLRWIRYVRGKETIRLQIKEENFTEMLEMLLAINLLILHCHTSACIFFFIGSNEVDANAWVHHWQGRLAEGEVPTSLLREPLHVQYFTSLYWSVVSTTSIGYGDIIPNTLIERIYATVNALVSAVILGYFVARMTKLIFTLRRASDALVKGLFRLQAVVGEKRVPEQAEHHVLDVSRRIGANWRRRVLENHTQESNKDVRVDVESLWWVSHVHLGDVFPEASSHLMPLLELKEFVYKRQGEEIVGKGDLCSHVYVLRKGSVQKEGKEIEMLSKGDILCHDEASKLLLSLSPEKVFLPMGTRSIDRLGSRLRAKVFMGGAEKNVVDHRALTFEARESYTALSNAVLLKLNIFDVWLFSKTQ